MKNFAKFLMIAILAMAFGTATYAQVSATATAAATIVSPIAIVKVTDLDFGNVAAGAAIGTVAMTPAGARTAGGGVTLPATTGSVSSASFTVTGTPGYTYSITLPGGATTISDGAAHFMTVDTWTSSPTPTGTLTGGTETLTVGATLHVGAAQTPGVYNTAKAGASGPFTVTVNYN